MNRLTKAILAIYILAGIVTFGHAANRFDKVCSAESGFCYQHGAHIPAAPFWPLYWSYVAFDESDI